jgi:hypothetical protein
MAVDAASPHHLPLIFSDAMADRSQEIVDLDARRGDVLDFSKQLVRVARN